MSSNADDLPEEPSDSVVAVPITAVTAGDQERNIATGVIAVGNDALNGRRPSADDGVVHGDEEPT
jgi:hypothetical protein